MGQASSWSREAQSPVREAGVRESPHAPIWVRKWGALHGGKEQDAMRKSNGDLTLERFLKGREIMCGLKDKSAWARCRVKGNSFSAGRQSLRGLMCTKHAGPMRGTRGPSVQRENSRQVAVAHTLRQEG